MNYSILFGLWIIVAKQNRNKFQQKVVSELNGRPVRTSRFYGLIPLVEQFSFRKKVTHFEISGKNCIRIKTQVSFPGIFKDTKTFSKGPLLDIAHKKVPCNKNKYVSIVQHSLQLSGAALKTIMGAAELIKVKETLEDKIGEGFDKALNDSGWQFNMILGPKKSPKI